MKSRVLATLSWYRPLLYLPSAIVFHPGDSYPHRSVLSTLAFRSCAEHPSDDFALHQRRLRAPMREIPSMRWSAEFKNGSVGVRDDGWVDSHHDGGHH